jgi:hypothetical protein
MGGVNPLFQQFDAVIGLEFLLRAVSKNPGIHGGMKLKKRPRAFDWTVPRPEVVRHKQKHGTQKNSCGCGTDGKRSLSVLIGVYIVSSFCYRICQ